MDKIQTQVSDMSERKSLAEPLLDKAEQGELSEAELESVRLQLDGAQNQLLEELQATSQGLHELEAQLADGVSDAFSLMHFALDELRGFLQSAQPSHLRLARLLFEKGEDEYRNLRGRLKRIEMHAASIDLPGALWKRVTEQAEGEELGWAEAEFSAHLQHFELAFQEAMQCLPNDRAEAERRIQLLQLRLTQLLV